MSIVKNNGKRRAFPATPVTDLGDFENNHLYIKRDDLIPYSFGGNKARKGLLFFEEIDAGDFDTVVTYGSTRSNHCRVVANLAAERGLGCILISPKEEEDGDAPTFNSIYTSICGAKRIQVPVSEVHDTIEKTLADLRSEGKKPYFIPGGGHGNIGTRAYVNCYEEIRAQERELGVSFDYLFFASGTGTTQAGLVAGKLLHRDDILIVGISIARKNPRGRDVVTASVREYLPDEDPAVIDDNVVFDDHYTLGSYGTAGEAEKALIRKVMIQYGIPLDSTYTGKAFYGMQQYLKEHAVAGKNVLFLHTGGAPLFFDDLLAAGGRGDEK
ncbi:MAG: 1-aminocyclopropane-1-carboxylate deaminase/D-cysteine desulfhydrase [Lachnospiraceae bacterium]